MSKLVDKPKAKTCKRCLTIYIKNPISEQYHKKCTFKPTNSKRRYK